MNVEGKGEVAPRPVTIVMDAGTIRACIIDSEKIAERYRNKTDRWGAGIKGPLTIANVGVIERHVRPTFAGKIGEVALVDYLRRHLGADIRVDFSIHKNGDGGRDVVAFGISHQVKTTQTENGKNLVKLPYEACHVFVFCEWSLGLVVELRGWCPLRQVARLTPVPSVCGGEWMNIEVLGKQLLPMCQLLDGLRARNLGGAA